MTQLTLPLETSVLIPINDIVETIPKTEFDENSDIIVRNIIPSQNDVKSNSICLHIICVLGRKIEK